MPKNIRGLEKVYGGLVLYQGTLVSLVFYSSRKVFMVRWACSGHGDATWLYSLLSYTAASKLFFTGSETQEISSSLG